MRINKLFHIFISFFYFVFALNLVYAQDILDRNLQNTLHRYATIEEQTKLFLNEEDQKEIADLMARFDKNEINIPVFANNQEGDPSAFKVLGKTTQKIYGDQQEFKRVTRQIIYVVTEAIKSKQKWVMDLDKVLAFMGQLRHQLARKSTGAESTNPFYGIRRDLTQYDPPFTSPLASGMRKELSKVSPYFNSNKDEIPPSVKFSHHSYNPEHGNLPHTVSFLNGYLIVDPQDESRCPAYNFSGEPLSEGSLSNQDYFTLSVRFMASRGYFTIMKEVLEVIQIVSEGKPLPVEKGPFVLHPDAKNIKRAMPFVKELYQQILQKYSEQGKERGQSLPQEVKRLHYFMAELTPIGFGGGAIGEWLALTFMNLYEIPFSSWKKETWAVAVTTSEKHFVENYDEFYELNPQN